MKARVISKIDVLDVMPDTAQPRQDWDKHQRELNDLQVDIEKNGLYYPIIVSPFYINGNSEAVVGEKAMNHKDRKWWILDGERRWRAVSNMGLTKIEALVRTELTLLEMMEIQFASNTKRLQVTIREMSKAVERYRDEYKKENEEYKEGAFIKHLCALTGYSNPYFGMVEAINRSDDDIREGVLSEKIGGYAPFEIERATRDDSLRRGLSDAFVESEKPISALAPRALKYDLKAIELENNHTDGEKRELAKQMLNDFVNRNNPVRDEVPNFLLYRQKAIKFRQDIRHWNLHDLHPNEIGKLIAVIEDIYNYFKEDRRANNQVMSKDRDNIIGKK